MAIDHEGLRDDLADLPDDFQDALGPTGAAVIDRALEEGIGFGAAMLAGNAAHASAWGKSEDDFRAEMIACGPGLLFEAVRDLLDHEGLWPWAEGEE